MMKTTARDASVRTYNILLSLGLGFVCCLLGACSLLRPLPPAETVETPLSPVEYYVWVQAASESDLQMELAGLESVPAGFEPIVTAVRTGIILSTSVLADRATEQKAQALITEAAGLEAHDDISSDYQNFAAVLASLLQRSKELEEVRDVNRLALREIDTLKSKNRDLQQQIEELTSIEQQIIEREQLNVRE